MLTREEAGPSEEDRLEVERVAAWEEARQRVQEGQESGEPLLRALDGFPVTVEIAEELLGRYLAGEFRNE